MSGARLVRYCRRRAGLTQRELADRLGLQQPAIARIESGRVSPRTETLDLLLSACGFQLELRHTADLDRTAIRELLRVSPRRRIELAAAEANNLKGLL